MLIQEIESIIEKYGLSYINESSIKGYSESELKRAWDKGNNNAEGFPPDDEVDNWKRLDTTNDGLIIYEDRKGRLVGVGDAHGPWAVVLDKYLD